MSPTETADSATTGRANVGMWATGPDGKPVDILHQQQADKQPEPKQQAQGAFFNENNIPIPDNDSVMNVVFKGIKNVSSGFMDMSKPAATNALHLISGISGNVRTDRAIDAMFPNRAEALSQEDLRQMRTDLGRNPDQVIGVSELSLQRVAHKGNQAVHELIAKNGLPKGGLTDSAVNEMAEKIMNSADYNSAVESNARKVSSTTRTLGKAGLATLAGTFAGGLMGGAAGLLMTPLAIITKPLAWCIDKVFHTDISRFAGPTGFIAGGAAIGAGMLGFKSGASVMSNNREVIKYNLDMRKAHKLALVQGIRNAVEVHEHGGAQSMQAAVEAAKSVTKDVAKDVQASVSTASAPEAASGIENGMPVGFRRIDAEAPLSGTTNREPVAFKSSTVALSSDSPDGNKPTLITVSNMFQAFAEAAKTPEGRQRMRAIENIASNNRNIDNIILGGDRFDALKGKNDDLAARIAGTVSKMQSAPAAAKLADAESFTQTKAFSGNPKKEDIESALASVERATPANDSVKPMSTPVSKDPVIVLKNR